MRKKMIHILLLCFVFQLKVKAQSSLPPAYPITNDTAAYTLTNEYIQVLDDKTGKWTLEQVNASPLSNEFHPYKDSINYSVHTHWLRYSLHNSMNSEINIGLYDDENQRSDLFLHYSSGAIKHIAGGWSLPWSKKTGLKDAGFIPFILRANEEVLIYQRIYNSSFFGPPPLWLSVNISSTQKALQQQDQQKEANYSNGLLDAFYYGFLGFAFLFNLIFFFIAKERAYLYFALYTLLIGLARYGVLLYLFREHPIAVSFFVFHVVYGLAAQFFQIHFIRHLVKSYHYAPRWDRWLVVLSFLPLATHLAYCFLPNTTSQYRLLFVANTATYPALNFVALATFVAVLYKQHWSDRLLMFAIFPPYFIWGMVFGTYMFFSLLHLFVTIPQTGFEVWLNRWWSVIETFVLGWLVLSFSWVLMRRFIEQRKQIHQLALEKETEKRLLIEQQKELLEQQVKERTADLKQSLENLKATQAQLIQQEKMASLGELTAGIAHEIQNPLNFVNNFSEVNNELIDELKEEAEKGNIDEVKMIADDIKKNSEKINQHGKRVDSIVKGMLQHSRKSEGTKEPTDINALCDEYLRLAYYGLRAKEKDFNTEMKTEFDETIGNVNLIPQDIGRVLLNLYNNAFYATNEKLIIHHSDYKPLVTVQTKKINSNVEITVSDNGNGIPPSIKEKIFQPFFTTKPTGQGTGLGLSLSYDIIKAHSGEIKVETKEGEGSEFIIQLPFV